MVTGKYFVVYFNIYEVIKSKCFENKTNSKLSDFRAQLSLLTCISSSQNLAPLHVQKAISENDISKSP
jgi:hypothetical protein